MEADLIFPESYKADGFTNNVTSSQAAEPDPVVRELLQNSLDAAIREAGRDHAEVHFTIVRRPVAALPGLSAYRRAFDAAVAQRAAKKGSQTHDERAVIDRIRGVLHQQEMSVLFCRDNGVGLDHTRMEALLTEGNSDKPMVGAGSYGLGHLTAFAASDLHYVLYAGRRNGANGASRDIGSGRAILAAHNVGQTRHAAEGFWRLPVDVFNLDDSNYPGEAPPLLRDEVERIDESGSVVAIVGFNDFREDNELASFEDVCRVAALNFLGAIWQGRMVVHVQDERIGQAATIDAASLEERLRQHMDQQRLPAGMRGWLVGSQGYRAWQTLDEGRVLDRPIDRSVELRFRALGSDTRERSRVQIFRDGMWITNDAPELGTGAFSGVRPFDAVVLLHDADPEDHGEFYDLVRNAEGPEHRGLTKYRDLSKGERDRLRGMLQQLAEQLKSEAGALDAEDGFTPEGFAVFNADTLREATKVPRPRHQPLGGGESGTSTTGGTATEAQEHDSSGKRTRRRHQRRAPATGTAVRMARSIVPHLDADGAVRRLSARVNIQDGEAGGDLLGLRVFVASGSDETCEQPLAPVWQPIRSVSVDGIEISGGGDAEVAIPRTVQSLEIELSEPANASGQFEIEVVRRRAKVKG